MRIDFGLV